MTIREAFLAGLSCGESGDVANYGGDWNKAADAYVAQVIPPGIASTKLVFARPATGLALVEVPPNCAVDGATSEVQSMLREIADELGELSQSAFNVRPQAWKFQDFAQRIDRVRTLLGAPTDGPFTADRAREAVGDDRGEKS